MSKVYKGYEAGKQIFGTIKNIFKPKKVFPTITKVAPNVGKPSKSALNKAIQKTKMSGAKLKQTLFESKNKAFRGDDFTFGKSSKKTPKVSEKKAKGGRVGLRLGTKKKSNVEKIKKTFGTLSVRAGIDNNPNPTYADKIAGAKMKNKTKKKII
tara:strand:- start:38 stop:499 length:462 start_codon:yes stop_codon:yes gene_type:complete